MGVSLGAWAEGLGSRFGALRWLQCPGPTGRPRSPVPDPVLGTHTSQLSQQASQACLLPLLVR